MALSQATTTHKSFISVLAQQRTGVTLLLEIEVCLGMRKYIIIITGDHGPCPVFKRELGHFSLPGTGPAGEDGMSDSRQGTAALSREEKGKWLMMQTGGNDRGEEGRMKRSVRMESLGSLSSNEKGS